ncbi:MAG: hypothetical protein WCT01_04615 [Candidatus Shapirobacteria bacterium]
MRVEHKRVWREIGSEGHVAPSAETEAMWWRGVYAVTDFLRTIDIAVRRWGDNSGHWKKPPLETTSGRVCRLYMMTMETKRGTDEVLDWETHLKILEYLWGLFGKKNVVMTEEIVHFTERWLDTGYFYRKI